MPPDYRGKPGAGGEPDDSRHCLHRRGGGLPVFRPLIGMDKEEIVRISRKIEAFDISIQPYEDCCTVFTPKHPRTRPVLKFVELAESGVEWEEMLREAADQAVMTKIGYAKE